MPWQECFFFSDMIPNRLSRENTNVQTSISHNNAKVLGTKI